MDAFQREEIEPLRVLIADDHLLFRDGLRTLLTAAPETEVVGEAGRGEEVIALAARLQPDVIIMDLQMPGVGGIEATRRVLHSSPHIGILVVTMFEDDHSVFAAMRAGARGYILKGATHAEMLRAVRVVGNGEAIFSPGVARRLMDFFSALQPGALPQAFPVLSEREREILSLIAQGYKNAEIATRLVLSPKTVRNHITNIFSKLQVVDRAQAILRAKEVGL
ncbi:MAG TPA: response regulator transcription factor [Ktedonobacteraceae bacterium]